MLFYKKFYIIILLKILLPAIVLCLPSKLPTLNQTSSAASVTATEDKHIKSRVWPRMPNYDIWGNGAREYNNKNNNNINNNNSSNINLIRPNKTIELFNDGLHNGLNQTTINNHRKGKVLNFFPVRADDECLSLDGRRAGVCLNVYECRIQGGTSSGQCALGFGVCCVFTATCDQEVFNNITYVVSPSFPALMPNDIKTCKLKIKMIDEDVSQLRLDFQHFALGQPNRRTGICDGDKFMLTGGSSPDFIICGQNSGQHVYYDVSAKSREEGVDMIIDLTGRQFQQRIWEIRIAQMTFAQRAPVGCMQYYNGLTGVIKTFNFAENGRHLANQDYRACVRQESGMCSIAYEPCDDQSFRIGVPPSGTFGTQGAGGIPGIGGMPGFGGPSFADATQAGAPGTLNEADAPLVDPVNNVLADDAAVAGADETVVGEPAQDIVNNDAVEEEIVADEPADVADDDPADVADDDTADDAADADDDQQADETAEGSGGADGGFFGFLPSFFSGRSLSDGDKQIPIYRDETTSDFHQELISHRQGRQSFATCSDRITLPCIIEDFIATGMGGVPSCEPIHCGSNLCASGQNPCRIETAVTPFALGIHFGDGIDKGSPEDNIGACLRYNQVACL